MFLCAWGDKTILVPCQIGLEQGDSAAILSSTSRRSGFTASPDEVESWFNLRLKLESLSVSVLGGIYQSGEGSTDKSLLSLLENFGFLTKVTFPHQKIT